MAWSYRTGERPIMSRTNSPRLNVPYSTNPQFAKNFYGTVDTLFGLIELARDLLCQGHLIPYQWRDPSQRQIQHTLSLHKYFDATLGHISIEALSNSSINQSIRSMNFISCVLLFPLHLFETKQDGMWGKTNYH